MILTNRKFEREPPGREAKSIYIFCEGAKREFQYFEYFKEMDSRINVEVHKLDSNDNNSPLGLLEIAKSCISTTSNEHNPKYTFLENDEVWLVLDIDPDKYESRKPQIEQINLEIVELNNWILTLSNPCFEVWLYYHLIEEKPDLDKLKICSTWKQLVNNEVNGGFDSRRHPIFIEKAIQNSKSNFEVDGNCPSWKYSSVHACRTNITVNED